MALLEITECIPTPGDKIYIYILSEGRSLTKWKIQSKPNKQSSYNEIKIKTC